MNTGTCSHSSHPDCWWLNWLSDSFMTAFGPCITAPSNQIWGSGSSRAPSTHQSLRNLSGVLGHPHPTRQLEEGSPRPNRKEMRIFETVLKTASLDAQSTLEARRSLPAISAMVKSFGSSPAQSELDLNTDKQGRGWRQVRASFNTDSSSLPGTAVLLREQQGADRKLFVSRNNTYYNKLEQQADTFVCLLIMSGFIF